MGLIDRCHIGDQNVTRLCVTDWPIGLNVVCETDKPIASDDIVTYLYNCFTDGLTTCSPGRSTDGLLTLLDGLFVEPIDRWSYAIYWPGRSTDGVLYMSFSNLVRWPEDWLWPINRWDIQYNILWKKLINLSYNKCT